MQSDKQGYYPVRPDSSPEFYRLSVQDKSFNDVFRLLPEGINAPERVLDVACGTGGWLRRIAHAYPQSECVGIDKSELLLGYARSAAESIGLSNVWYKRGDMLELEKMFRGKHFDLIQVRCSSWFLGSRKKDMLLACKNLLTSGGTLRVIDYKTQSHTNSESLMHFGELFSQALQMRGTPFLGADEFLEIFQGMGMEHIVTSDYSIDLSYGAKDRDVFLDDILSSQQTVGKLVVASGLATEEEFAAMREQGIADTQQTSFTGSWQFMEVVGQKPA